MNNIVRVIILAMVICVCSGCTGKAPVAPEMDYKTKVKRVGFITNIPNEINRNQIWDYVENNKNLSRANPKEGYFVKLGPSGDPSYNDWEYKLFDNQEFEIPEEDLSYDKDAFIQEKVLAYGYKAARKYVRMIYIDTPSFCVNRKEDGSITSVVILDPTEQPWWEERTKNLNSSQKWLLEEILKGESKDVFGERLDMLIAIERGDNLETTRFNTCN